MDGLVDSWVAELDARFDALVARDEERAAGDLAASLYRGLTLRERLRAGGRGLDVLTAGGARTPVSSVGAEHLGCGTPLRLVVRLEHAVVASTEAPPPDMTSDSLMQVLRPWAERARWVEVAGPGRVECFAGQLVAASSDHLLLQRGAEVLVLPLATVGTIRLVRGD